MLNLTIYALSYLFWPYRITQSTRVLIDNISSDIIQDDPREKKIPLYA